MSCKKVCLEMNDKPFTSKMIAEKSGLKPKSVRSTLIKLSDEGLLIKYSRVKTPLVSSSKKSSSISDSVFIIFDWDALKASIGVKTRRSKHDNGWDRLWRATRVLKIFGTKDLVITADVGITNAERFISLLLKAGFLMRRRDGKLIEWTFINDPGPIRPNNNELRVRAEARREENT